MKLPSMSRLGWNSSQPRSSLGLYPSLWATAAATAAAELNSMSSCAGRLAEVRARVLLSRGARAGRDRLAGRLAVLRGFGADGDGAGEPAAMSSARTNRPPPPEPPGTYFLFLNGGSSWSWSLSTLPRERTGTRAERELRGVVGLEDIASIGVGIGIGVVWWMGMGINSRKAACELRMRMRMRVQMRDARVVKGRRGSLDDGSQWWYASEGTR